MYTPDNFLKRLLDAGLVTQEDVQNTPSNALRGLLMPGDSGGFVRREASDGDPGQTTLLNGQPGGAFDSVPVQPRQAMGYPDQASRAMGQPEQQAPQQLAPQAMAPQQQRGMVPIKMAGYGNDGIISDLGSTIGPAPQLDVTRPQVDTPKGRGYYGKDGAVYVAGPDGYTKIVMGYDRNASLLQQKADLERRKGEQDIAQSQAATEHSQEATRASQVNNPDMGNMSGPAGMGVAGDEVLKQLDPGTAGLVKAYAEGRMAFPGGAAMRSPRMMQLLSLVSAYDPSFDAKDFNTRNRAQIAFTSGKQADAVRAADQAIAHAGALNEDITSLNNFNGVMTPLNSVINPAQSMFGDPRQGRFKQNALALSSELRKVFSGSGGGSLSELQKRESGLPLNASQEQQKAYLAKGMDLLQGAIGALNDQYQRAAGPRANVKNLFSPKAQEVLTRLETGGAAPAASADVGAPPEAVAHLKANPSLRTAFDMKYGQGAAAQVLGR